MLHNTIKERQNPKKWMGWLVLLLQFLLSSELCLTQPGVPFSLLHVCLSSGTAPTRGSPGLQNQTSSTGRPGFHGDSTTGAPGFHTTRSRGGVPGMVSPGVTGQPGLHKTTPSSTVRNCCWSNWLSTHCWASTKKLTWIILGVTPQQATGLERPSTQESPQVNLDCISQHPSTLEDLGCKPQKVRTQQPCYPTIRQEPWISTE